MRARKVRLLIAGITILSITALGTAKVYVIDFETGAYNQGCRSKNHPCGDKQGSCDCKVGVSMKVVKKSDGHPVRSGSYSSYHRLANCHERAEWFEGCPLGYNKEVWIGWSMFVPAEYAGGGSISQFHDRFGGGGKSSDSNKPGPCGGYKHGGPTIYSYSGSSTSLAMRHEVNGCLNRKGLKIGSMPKGKWVDLVVNAVFSADPGKGFIKMWQYEAGKKPQSPQINYKGSTYWQYKNGSNNGGPVFRTGIYRGNPGKVPGKPVFLYVDEIRWGHAATGVSFEDVAPGDAAAPAGTGGSGSGTIEPPAGVDVNASHIKLNFGGTVDGWPDGSVFAPSGMTFTFFGTAVTEGAGQAGPAEMYQTVVHRGASTDDLKFTIKDLPDGEYTLRFHVADQYGGRAIDILAEGKKVVEDLDPVTEGGGELTAVVKEAAVTVTGGDGLEIVLTDDRPEPKDVFLSGLEIIRKGGVALLPATGVQSLNRRSQSAQRFLLSGRTARNADQSAGVAIEKVDGALIRRVMR